MILLTTHHFFIETFYDIVFIFIVNIFIFKHKKTQPLGLGCALAISNKQ